MLLSLLLAGALAASAQSQGPSRESTTSADAAVIAGRVVADATGAPIRNARVTLSPASPETAVVLTDDTGAFRLTAPAGRYAVVASKTGYARGGATAAGSGEPVEVRLKKGAAIVGRVLDERGDPVAGVQVAALTQAGAGNSRTTAAATDTDDRGEYRLSGLAEGTFVVGVTTLGATGVRPTARIPDPRTTYSPGATTIEDAEVIRLQTGEERLGADIVVAVDRLAGTPEALFTNRFLPRPPPVAVQLGLQKAIERPMGSVRGSVVTVDGTPLPLARVYLFTGDNVDSKMATADEAGRFTIDTIAAGPLLVSVVKPGYAQVESGRPLPFFQMGRSVTSPSPSETQFGRRIELTAEESQTIELQMGRLGSLSGTVADEYGDPMQGVVVEVLRVRFEAGRRRLVSAATSRLTDDRGLYRLSQLPPGRYIVSAAVGQVSSDDLPEYARAYFPGTTNTEEAQYVSVGFAQDVAFADISMSRARTARVAGIVFGPNGEPTMPGSLTLAPSGRSSSVTSVAVGARVAADGTFVFPNVMPGEYVIQAYRGRENDHTEGVFGAAVVSVGTTDVAGVVVRTSAGSSMTGRFRFDVDDRTMTPQPSDFELTAVPVDFDRSPPANPARAEIDRDWTFRLAGLNGPRRLRLVRRPPGYALEEIRVNGVDVTDQPISLGTRAQSLANIEVVLTDRVTELSGAAADDRGRPLAGAMVVVFSGDRQQWYAGSRYVDRVFADQNGVFVSTGLPPGNYFARATLADPEEGWHDPQFLESLVPGAPTIGLVSGQKAVVKLQMRSR